MQNSNSLKRWGLGALTALLFLILAGPGLTQKAVPTPPRQEFVYINAGDNIYQFRQASDGTLIPLSPATAPMQTTPGYVGIPVTFTVDEARKFAYATYLEIDFKVKWTTNSKRKQVLQVLHHFEKQSIYQYRISENGTLVPLSPARIDAGKNVGSGSVQPSLQITKSGRFAYFADSGVRKDGLTPVAPIGGIIARYRINSDGTLQALTPFLIPERYGNPVLKLDPSGRYAYIYDVATQLKANKTEVTITQCRIMPDGSLVPLQPALVHLGQNAIWDLVLSPNGRNAYAILSKWGVKDEDSTYVTQFSVRPEGALVPLTPSELGLGYYATTLSIAPDGKRAYSQGGPKGPLVVQYKISSKGALSLTTHQEAASQASGMSFTLAPTGQFAYAVSYTESSGESRIFQYALDPSGLLHPLNPKSIAVKLGPASLYIDPLCQFLYTQGPGETDLSLYRINTGLISLVKPRIFSAKTAPDSVTFVVR